MINNNCVSSRQIRAARALLDWSQEDLADTAGISVATIRKLELGYISPRHSTTSIIRQAIENAGLEFIQSDGVRRRLEDVAVYQGPEGVSAFFDDMLQTTKKCGGNIEVVMTPASASMQLDKVNDYAGFERIAHAGVTSFIKCLLAETLIPPLPMLQLEYRSISRHYVDPIPLYIYGDKYAIIVNANEPEAKIVVVQSVTMAQASRRQFYSIWEKATPIALSNQENKITKINAYR